MTQYVIYNDYYGGFNFNYDFILSLFKRYPPDTPEGAKLFKIYYDEPTEIKTTSYFYDDYILLYQNEDIASYIKNIKTNKIYIIVTYMQEHRANPDIINFLFERIDEMTDEKFNYAYSMFIQKYKHLDISKTYTKQNWKECELLMRFLLTYDISGPLSELAIIDIKPGYKWHISDYDGIESVIISYDYDILIKELVHELQLNKIKPSSNCSETVAKIIRGEITLDDILKS